jgi:hypothetical protein
LIEIAEFNPLSTQQSIRPELLNFGEVYFKRASVAVTVRRSSVMIKKSLPTSIVQMLHNEGHRANEVKVILSHSIFDYFAYTAIGFRFDLVELNAITISNSGLVVMAGGGTIVMSDSIISSFHFGKATYFLDYLRKFFTGSLRIELKSGFVKDIFENGVGIGFFVHTFDTMLSPRNPANILCRNSTFRHGLGSGALIRLLSYEDAPESSLALETCTFEFIMPSSNDLSWHLITPSEAGTILIVNTTFNSFEMAGRCAWISDHRFSVNLKIVGSDISNITGMANHLFCISKSTTVLSVIGSVFKHMHYTSSMLISDFAGTSAAIVFENTTVAHCSASSLDGTTMALSAFARAHFDQCTFIGNSGRFGGVFKVDKHAVLFLKSCQFEKNTAANGGVASVSHGAHIISNMSSFLANEGSSGGVFDLTYPGFVTLINSTIKNNVAPFGGVLHAVATRLDSVLSVEGRSTISDNVATKGAVVYMPSGSDSLVEAPSDFPFSEESRIESNAAEAAGGVFYVINPHDGIEKWKLFLQALDEISFNNTAPSGSLIGSPPLSIEIVSNNTWFTQRSGHNFDPPLNVTVFDHFNQTCDGNWFVRNYDVYFNDVLIKPISGAVGTFQVFEALPVDVPPNTAVNGVLEVNFLVEDIVITRALHFRTEANCLDGEVQDEDGICMPCMRNTFSLMYRTPVEAVLSADNDPVLDTNQCRSCPKDIDCTGGTLLMPSIGHWLRTEHSTYALECLSFSGCAITNTNVTGQYVPSCQRKGAKSPMCLQCEDGYSRWYGECWDCNEKSAGFAFLNFFTLTCTMILLLHSQIKNNASYMYMRVLISYLQVIRMFQVIHTDLYGSARVVNSVLSIISNALTAWDNPFVSCALSSLTRFVLSWIYLLILPGVLILVAGASIRGARDRRSVFSSSLFQCWFLLHGWLVQLTFASVTRLTLDKALREDGILVYPGLQDDSFTSLQYMDGDFFSTTNIGVVVLNCLAIVVIVIIAPLIAMFSIRSATSNSVCGFDKGYRAEFGHWEISKFFMKCLIATVVVSYQYKPANLQYFQGFTMLILTVMLGAHAFLMPHKTATLNALDMLSYLALMAAVVGHVMYLAEGLVSDHVLAPLTAVVIAVPNFSLILLALTCVLRENRSTLAVVLRIK